MDMKKIKVGAFQFSTNNCIADNLSAIKRGISLAANENVRLLLTQECALCGYPPIELPNIESIDKNALVNAIEEIKMLSRKYNMYIALGTITFDKDNVYNSVQLITPENENTDIYHKRALWGWDIDNFKRGNNEGIYNIDGIKIGIRICYEVRFPEYFRELFRSNVDLCLISFTDVGSPELKEKINVIQSHLISRATENAMYVLSSNSLSNYQLAPTCLIDPDGYIIKKAPLNYESLICHKIEFGLPEFGRRGRIVHSKELQKKTLLNKSLS